MSEGNMEKFTVMPDDVYYMESFKGGTRIHAVVEGRGAVSFSVPQPVNEVASTAGFPCMAAKHEDDVYGFAINFDKVADKQAFAPHKTEKGVSMRIPLSAGEGYLVGRYQLVSLDDFGLVAGSSITFKDTFVGIFPASVEEIETMQRQSLIGRDQSAKPDVSPN